MEFNPNAGFRFWFSGHQYGRVTIIGGEVNSAVESYPANAPVELKQFVQRG